MATPDKRLVLESHLTDATTQAGAKLVQVAQEQVAPVDQRVTDLDQEVTALDQGIPQRVADEMGTDGTPANTVLTSTIASTAAVVNLEAGGVYPPRPDAPVVAWVGNADPDAFMGAEDYWVNLSAPAPLTLPDLQTEFQNPSSGLTTAARAGIGAGQSVWVPASQFAASIGTPTLNGHASTYLGDVSVWRLDPAIVELVSTTVQIPAGWTTAKITLYWAPLNTSGGEVRSIITANPLVGESQVSASMQMIETNMPASATSGTVTLYTPASGNSLNVTPGVPLRVGVGRRADHAADTNTGDVAIIGLMLSRLS